MPRGSQNRKSGLIFFKLQRPCSFFFEFRTTTAFSQTHAWLSCHYCIYLYTDYILVLYLLCYLLLLIYCYLLCYLFSDLRLCIFVQLLQKFLKENGDKFKRSYKSDQKIYAVSSHWLKLQLSETKKVLKFAKKKTQHDSLHIFKSNCNKLKLIDATSIAWLLSD